MTELYNSVLELKDQIKDKFSIQIFDKYEKCLKNDLVKNEILSLPDFLYNDNLVSLNDLKSVPLGIKNGITGLGLKLIKQRNIFISLMKIVMLRNMELVLT